MRLTKSQKHLLATVLNQARVSYLTPEQCQELARIGTELTGYTFPRLTKARKAYDKHMNRILFPETAAPLPKPRQYKGSYQSWVDARSAEMERESMEQFPDIDNTIGVQP